ncbi:MAG: family transporter [Nevskia sp.]|nr:family transporter [Nevskia sp.]
MQRERPFPAIANADLATWAVAAAFLVLIMQLKLLSGLLSALLVYELVHVLADRFKLSSISRNNAKLVAVALLTGTVVLALTLLIIGAASALRHGNDSLPALLQKLAEILDSSRQRLPASLNDYLPTDADELREKLTGWLRAHSGAVGGAGVIAGRVFAHILIGMVIGALLALRGDSGKLAERGPLAAAIAEQGAKLSEAFRRVVFAQAWIAGINAVFTAIYLMVILPLCGIHLPLTKTMVTLTLFAGLVPIVGNLISNSVIVIVSLSSSLPVAVASLAFLIGVHKLEYFLNARIIGSHIRAKAWELLVAMVLMEATFGIPGVIAAPIFYAYFKNQLAEKGLV